MAVRHYRSADGISGYKAGDVLVNDDTGERSLVVRDGRGLALTTMRGRRPERGETASETIKLRLTPEERARWQALADQQDITLAELVREAVEMAIARGASH